MALLYERRSQRSRLGSRHPAVFILQLFWVITIIWCQFGAFFYSLAHCRWPDKVLQLRVSTIIHLCSSWSYFFSLKPPTATKPTRVLLIADAQVPNPATQRSWWGEDHVTMYLRKSWSVTSRLRPDVVIFLGDTLASGRYVMSKEEYVYLARFNSLQANILVPRH